MNYHNLVKKVKPKAGGLNVRSLQEHYLMGHSTFGYASGLTAFCPAEA